MKHYGVRLGLSLVKNTMRFLIFLALSAMFLSGCTSPQQEQSGYTKKYFDLKGLVLRLQDSLNQAGPQLSKTVYHNGKSETQTSVLEDWETELAIFQEMDINKPVLRDSYEIRRIGESVQYVAREDDLYVQELYVGTNEAGEGIIRIHAHQINALFSLWKDLELGFMPSGALKWYQIKSLQEVVFQEGQRYQVKGELE